MPNPITRAEAKQMMIAALDGQLVNEEMLANPGACAYKARNGAVGTCIVGSLMTPEQRSGLVLDNRNGEMISVLLRDNLAQLMWFGGLTPVELSELQKIFDDTNRTSWLLENETLEARKSRVLVNLRAQIENLAD